MRILFDHQVFSWQTYGGISRYFAEQLRGLKALGQEVYLPEQFFSENVYLRAFPEFQRKSLTNFPFKGKKWLQNIWGRGSSLQAIEQIQADVFHPTYFDPYFLKTLQKRGIPFVITVHDMIHEIYGHGSQGLFSLDAKVVEHKKLLAERAAAVIVVSENTRKDLLRFCPEIDPDKIKVIYHGNSMHPSHPPSSADAGFIPSPSDYPYLLFVGQRKAYKNFSWMIAQLAPLLLSEKDLHLICVGGSDFDPDEREQLTHLGLSTKVLHHTIGSDAELARLYQQAACFIFPSRYEGFGIPVLEAFACACPVLLNEASSLPEVGGNAAVYFKEEDPGSLEASLRQILEDTAFRERMIQRGRERVKQFTWEQSAKEHLGVYQSIVH